LPFVFFVVNLVFVFLVVLVSVDVLRLLSRAASGRIGSSSPTIINACAGRSRF
jgi:hypothetical protein